MLKFWKLHFQDVGKDFEVVNYLETIPSTKKLNYIVNLLGISPIELVRKNEILWKQNYKNKTQILNNEYFYNLSLVNKINNFNHKVCKIDPYKNQTKKII